MLSGQYMHNHGVRGNFPPNGSWFKFRSHESNDLPVWLQDDGYYNVHIGKYMNGYSTVDGTLPVPQGWDEWYGKVSEDALYFDYNLIEKTSADAPRRTSPSTATSRTTTRPTSSATGRSTSSRTAPSREPAVLAQPLVQLAARAV